LGSRFCQFCQFLTDIAEDNSSTILFFVLIFKILLSICWV
jgi:hypothetical protein